MIPVIIKESKRGKWRIEKMKGIIMQRKLEKWIRLSQRSKMKRLERGSRL